MFSEQAHSAKTYIPRRHDIVRSQAHATFRVSASFDEKKDSSSSGLSLTPRAQMVSPWYNSKMTRTLMLLA